MALRGVKVIEMAGLAPAPFCGMILSDFGAKVVRVDRVKGTNQDVLSRGKLSIAVDLKKKEGIDVVCRLCETADVLIEPFRNGVMEKLGLGPERLTATNPKLIYARLTGYGQSGELCHKAGHDINYIAISGVLSQLGRAGEKPHAPVNLLADFGGGGLTCALGIMMALFECTRSNKGQVIDANMVQGSAYLSSFLWLSRNMIKWGEGRGENLLDGGAAFYDTYKTSDGKHVAVGALEPQFYRDLLKGLQLNEEQFPQLSDQSKLRSVFTEVFSSRTRDYWVEKFANLDACVTPVLEMDEAPNHAHNESSKSFVKSDDTTMTQPSPAPGLSRTPAIPKLRQPKVGQHTREVLADAGYSKSEIQNLEDVGAVVHKDTVSKL